MRVNALIIDDFYSNPEEFRDFALQQEFKKLFGDKILYRRKKGEDEGDYSEIIEKDFAAQIISTVYLQEPHNTHLKQNLFGSNYTKIFSRKITAEKLNCDKTGKALLARSL